ncbi:DUF4810 domain-containing protein [Chitinimonas naiadis]
MQQRISPRWLTASALAAAVLLSACAAPNKNMYGWGSYQQQVYEHFKGDGKGPQDQLAALEQDMQTMRAKGQAIPPGYHAHLALLYGELGRDAEMQQHLAEEKALFPESTTFMDFLLSKTKKNKGAS